MTRARTVAALLFAGAAAVAPTVPSGAQTTPGYAWTAGWTAPADDPGTVSGPPVLEGWFRYGPSDDTDSPVRTIAYFDVEVELADGAVVPTGCDERVLSDLYEPPEEAPDPEGDNAVQTFSFPPTDITPQCNGKYEARVRATAFGNDTHTITKALNVAIVPPPVTSLNVSTGADRSVTLVWSPPSAYRTASSGTTTTSTTSSTTPTVTIDSSGSQGTAGAAAQTPARHRTSSATWSSDPTTTASTRYSQRPAPAWSPSPTPRCPTPAAPSSIGCAPCAPAASSGTTALAVGAASATRDVIVTPIAGTPTTRAPGGGGPGPGTGSGGGVCPAAHEHDDHRRPHE